MKPDRRRQKSKLTMYHIGPRPAQPKQRMSSHWWAKKSEDPAWERYWLDKPVKSGVFLSTNPVGVATNHGVYGNVYAYKVSQKVIKQSGGIHRYDRGTEIIIPEDIWNENIRSGDIEFLGKSMNRGDFEKKVNKSWSDYNQGWGAPGSIRGRPGWDNRESKPVVPQGLINSANPELAIKMMTDEERRNALAGMQTLRNTSSNKRKVGWNRQKTGGTRPEIEPPLSKKEQLITDLLKQYLGESLLRLAVRKILLETEVEEEVLDSFKPRQNLEPKLFTDKKLDPQIKDKLIQIAEDFMEKFEFPFSVEDITLTGSLANYNWSKYSDIDIHILVDFDMVDENTELVYEAFGASGAVWNNQHDIFIEGYEVEIYVQNTREPHHSTGVYSLKKDRWIKEPGNQDQEYIPSEVRRQAKLLINRIDHIEKLVDLEEYENALESIERLKRKVKRMREQGLASQGEYSPENLAFKVLRRMEQLDRVNKLKFSAYDKLMTLEEEINA